MTDRAALTLSLSDPDRSLLLNEIDLYAFSARAKASSNIEELAQYNVYNALALGAQKAADALEAAPPGDLTFSGDDRIAIMGALSNRILGYRQMAERLEGQGITAGAKTVRILEGALMVLVNRFNMDAPPPAEEPNPFAHPGHSEPGD
jgi:hypothetical protein